MPIFKLGIISPSLGIIVTKGNLPCSKESAFITTNRCLRTTVPNPPKKIPQQLNTVLWNAGRVFWWSLGELVVLVILMNRSVSPEKIRLMKEIRLTTWDV